MKGTGTLRKWAFPRIDWDVAFQEGRVTIHEEELDLINKTELVEILRLHDIRVDRGYGIEELQGILRRLGKGQEVHAKSMIDKFREVFRVVWENKKSVVRDQLPPNCELDCYKHPDLMVAQCYRLNRESIVKL